MHNPRRVIRLTLVMWLLLLPLLAACRATPSPAPTAPSTDGTPATASPSNPESTALELTILHTNDVQGEIDPCG